MTSRPVDFRIAVVGETGVGKTSLVNQYSTSNFCAYTRPTIGIDSSDVISEIDRKLIHLKILDVGGGHQFGYLSRSYLRTVDAIIFMYDITDKESFAFLPYWTTVAKSCRNNVIKVLVGNKKDLATSSRQVTFKTAKTFADFEGMVTLEVSAKDGMNVDLLFQCMSRELQVQKEQRSLKHIASEQQFRTLKFERGGFKRQSLPLLFIRGVSSLCGTSRFKAFKTNFVHDESPLEWV